MNRTDLYRDHLSQLDQWLTDAVERAGRQGLGDGVEGIVFHAGRPRLYHRDDREIAFYPAAHFRRWVPLDGPEHLVLARPGRRPLVVQVQPRDFWNDTSAPPPSFWEGEVDLEVVGGFEQAREVLGPAGGFAYFGDSPEAAAQLGIAGSLVEPDALRLPLDWHRAIKTPYEVDCLRRAARKAAEGHRAAHRCAAAGGSEREIHWEYLEASDQLERDVPYETIIALDDKGAILHYQKKRGADGPEARVLLIDAGAAFDGYAADVTRTWCLAEVPETFRALVEGVDALERRLVDGVRAGRPYWEIHLEAHRLTAQLLVESGVLRVGADEAVERRLTRAFLPHGVGHQLGLQVHDVGGHQAAPDGGVLPPPDDHVLRNTRTLEPGHVVTIEPGIYFIPMLLDPLRSGTDSQAIDWPLVDELTPFGGIRIEDDVLCTEEGPEDLTRPLLDGPRQARAARREEDG